MPKEPWRIRLLGELRATCGEQDLTRFHTQKTAGLFAYLAYHLHRAHPREELIELFWPDSELESGRMNLRTSLAALRRALEPSEAESVLLADRHAVRLNPDRIVTDVTEFTQALKTAEQAEPVQQAALLTQAIALYSGDLLPGYYDDWITLERTRLAELYLTALRQLSAALQRQGDHSGALEIARRAVQSNPLEEEAHYALIRLYAALGRQSAAVQHYRELERLLHTELNVAPTQSLASLLTIEPSAIVSETVASPAQAKSASVPALPAASEAPVALSEPPPLPTPLTPFFGREEEIAQITVLLEMPERRLVTLTGLGGTGKTRLALEVASRLRQKGAKTVYFVSLTDTTDPRLIAETVRVGMRLPAGGSQDIESQILEALGDAPTLLVLDNFEQLLEDGGPQFVARLLERQPQLTCLITSRLPLGLNGEWEYPVPSLPTPALPDTPERLMEYPSVRLFVTRAQATRPDFQITPTNAQAVAQVCHFLEGLPLALELAAARAQVMTPAQMAHYVVDRFGFLVSRQRDANQRQSALRAVLDWSYQALSESHRNLLTGLSAFRGGWSLEAAEAVCAEPFALDYLMDLRAASLVVTREEGETMRFRMLETVREYAAQRLMEHGGVESVRKRHRDYYLRLAEEARQQFNRAEQSLWLERLDAEQDNLRVALDTCADASDGGEAGLRLTGALYGYWDRRGLFLEAWERYRAALAHPDAQARTEARAAALAGAGNIASTLCDYTEAERLYTESLEINRERDHPEGIAALLACLGEVRRNQGEYAEARSLFEQALVLNRDLNLERGSAAALVSLGLIATTQGDYATASACYEEGLAIKRRYGDTQSIATSLDILGRLARLQGDPARARALYEESLTLRRAGGNRWGIAGTLCSLGALARLEGDFATAQAFLEEALEINRGLGDRQGVATLLENLAFVASTTGDITRARALARESLTLRRDLGDRVGAMDALDAAAWVATLADHREQAVRLWGATCHLREAFGLLWSSQDRATFDTRIQQVREALGSTAFDAGWTAGETMTWEQAIAFALESL